MRHLAILFVITCVGTLAAQQGDILTGKIKKLDADRLAVTLAHNGADREYFLTEQTKVFGSDGTSARERLKSLKEGAAVLFKLDGKNLVGIKPNDAKPSGPPPIKLDSSK